MSRTLAVEWLAQCRANENGKHDICNMPKSSTLPTRLLDLKHCRKTGQLRLILPAADPSLFAGNNDFITLSHCWGEWGARRNPLLTQDNLADRQATGLPLDGLPKTFRDAIQVAYWFRGELRPPLAPHEADMSRQSDGSGSTASASSKIR